MLLERYSAKPEPPQSLFPSQKAPDSPKAVVEVQQKSPGQMSEESGKSSDHSPPPQPPPVPPDLRTTISALSEVVPTSVADSFPSDPRLLVQFLLKQTRQSAVPTDGNVSTAGDQSPLAKPSTLQELHATSGNSLEIAENYPEKADKNKTAYSPSQADYLGEDEGNQLSENVRETKVCVDYLTL